MIDEPNLLLLSIAALLTAGLVAVLSFLHTGRGPMSLDDLFTDPATGRMSAAHTTLIGAFVASSTVLVWESAQGRMTGELWWGYLGAWTALKGVETWARRGALPEAPMVDEDAQK